MAPKKSIPAYDYGYEEQKASKALEPEAPKESERDKLVAQFKKLHVEDEPLYSSIFAQLRSEGYPV